ncbi:hypothetical protein CANARDRAFT_27246 [[Candida] arabinofermentans NRRL YB-2248]|uniref:Uncharacterized protein n=1 Tax=[Candida] arabinofermentans NRRL YB-2248 TaxID=983967 RepID=A0A1E4T557_9ASCO|nr:hypothetical protein CANARDRAFT_27246 [[Candida] arabinofermentans NRRL YB-2248]
MNHIFSKLNLDQGYQALANNLTERKPTLLRNCLLGGIILNLLFFIYQTTPHKKQHNSHTKLPSLYSDLNSHNYNEYLQDIDFLNASAIFNEVSNAVKQKNADLNPISVSFFPAYIPEGTLLYHSTHGGGEIPTSFEWVAMDYEFSYNFAHFNRNKPRGGPGGGPGGPGGGPGGPGGGPGKGPGGGGGGPGKHHPGGPGKGPGGPGWGNSDSYMLTFQVVKPLDKLIYLGGASAAKTSTGEMDTQFLLSQIENYEDFDEGVGAKEICAWGKANGGLDGIIRLEIGFEIIICDFYEKLELVSDLRMTNLTNTLGFPVEKFDSLPEDGDEDASSLIKRDEEKNVDDSNAQRSHVIDILEAMTGYEQYEAGKRVYDGDQRILLDFSKFVTPLNKTYLDPDTYTRRIDKLPSDLKKEILNDVKNMLQTPNDPYSSTNWQVITYGIVEKFGPMLLNLNSSLHIYDSHHDLGILGTNLTTYTFNFIRRYLKEPEYELTDELKKFAIWDYAHPLQPLKSKADHLIWNSIVEVQTVVLEAVNEVYLLGKKLINHSYNDGALDENIDHLIIETKAKLDELLAILDWSVFYQCTNVCKSNEICFIPTWGPSPLGWGGSDLGYVVGDDGIKRISKECVCLGYNKLMGSGL